MTAPQSTAISVRRWCHDLTASAVLVAVALVGFWPTFAGPSFVPAVIGGIGHVPGAVVGALLLGLVEEFVVGYASSTWRDAVAFAFLILVLLSKPEGLFGKVTAEKV